MITVSPSIAALAAAAALLLLGACSGGAPGPVAPATGTPASSPATPTAERYGTVMALKDAAVAAGYPCPNWQQDTEPGPKYADLSGSCSDEDVFSTYATDADAQSQVELGTGTINMLVGPNWIINIPEQHRAALQAKLGGEHVPGELDEPTDEPTTPDTADYVPRKSDFALSIKVLDKQCFGSAGCLVEYRPRINDASDGRLPSTGTTEVSYKITGAEDPIQGTFTIDHEADTVEGQDEESTQTPRSSSTLRIAITDMEYYG